MTNLSPTDNSWDQHLADCHCPAIPAIDPAAIREAALREAAAKCEYTIRNIQILKSDGETYETPRVQKIAQGLVEVARQEILALIGEKK